MNHFVVLSGCSGGGKSTLLAELGARGFATVPEPGRRIVRAEMASGGAALPWLDMAAFAQRATDMALADRAAAAGLAGWVFFDRGLIDAAVALEQAGGERRLHTLAMLHPYHPMMFLAPPWAEIYVQDAERPKDFANACAEHERLARAYAALGYHAVDLPRASPAARADFVLAALAQ